MKIYLNGEEKTLLELQEELDKTYAVIELVEIEGDKLYFESNTLSNRFLYPR